MGSWWADIRYAARLWIRNPGFTAVAVLTLALGIGANATMFSVANATLFRPVPFPDSDSLQTIWKGRVNDPANLNIVSLPNYRDWVSRSRSFASLALFDSAGRGYNLSGASEPERVSGVRVTASFFDVLGVPPLFGRTFRQEEEQPGRDRVVVLSHGLWTRRYGADPAILGRTITVDGLPFTVVGVMPAHFTFQFWGGPLELWVPAGWTTGDQDRNSNSFVCIGRIRPGVTLSAARAEMDTIGRALAGAYPDANAGWTVRVVPVNEYGVRNMRPAMLAMLGIVGFVLLIASANVANLMLARAAVRQTELAIRSAIGAGRARLARQLLTESVLLAIGGGVCGIVLAAWATSVLPAVFPNLSGIPLRPLEFSLDGRVLAFTSAVSIATGMLFGLAPVLTLRVGNLSEPLKDGGRTTAGGRTRLRYSLVACEVALTVVVLAGAGMMIASVARLAGVDPGLDTRNVLVVSMSQPQEDLYYGPPAHASFCRALTEQVGTVPGVRSVSAIGHLPLSGGTAGRGIAIEGRQDPGPENQPGGRYTVVCPDLLATLGIPLVAGRDFNHRDVAGAPGVVLINDAMAARLWPGEQAVGKRFKIGRLGSDNPWLTVVGVFRTFKHSGLDDEQVPQFFRPFAQAGWPSVAVVAKTAGPPLSQAEAIKKALAVADPGQPVSEVRTMEDVVARSVGSRKAPMILLTAFALLALVLAAVGVAGVVGYTVVQRSREIGVRMALGAQPGDVVRLVIGESLSWMGGGLVAGLLGAVVLVRALGSLLYGVTPTDPLVLGTVCLLLALVTTAASVIPARRATRIDPLQALRHE